MSPDLLRVTAFELIVIVAFAHLAYALRRLQDRDLDTEPERPE